METKLVPDDGASGDRFGCAVSASGDTAVVGAYQDDDIGSAYVYVRSGGAWAQQQKLTPGDGASGDRFGYAVSVSGDTVVVGAYQDDDVGSAYVFVRSGETWTQQQKLTPGDGAPGDRFGHAVSVSGDTVVVGAYQDDDVGSAYVFVRSGETWAQQQKLASGDGVSGDRFGYAISVSGDTVVAGAYQDDDEGLDSGSAYVYVRSGGAWTQQQKLTADDGASNDRFGYALSVSGDTVVAGAYQDDDEGLDSGSAYVYVRSGGTWTRQQKLTVDDGDASDNFGYALSISGDTAVVGAHQDDDIGSAYVYVRNGETWTRQQKITPYDGASGDRFGYALSVSGDAVLITAPWDDDGGSASGSTYAMQILPQIDSISPGMVDQGETLDVTITGVYFDGTSEVSFGSGVTVNSFSVDSHSRITADITVADHAMTGSRDVSVTTSRGSITVSNGLVIQQPLPTITWFSPEVVNRGETLDVTITGIYFTGAIEVNLGTGITVNSFSVDSPFQITASITVSPDAWIGARDITVATARGSDTLVRGFDLEKALPDGGGGCGCCTNRSTTAEIVSGWGLVGMIGLSALYVSRKRKRK